MYTPTLVTFVPALLFLSKVPFAYATPPACLIAALNQQPDPSDIQTLCGALQPAVSGNITEKCSADAIEQAVSSYQNTCSQKGYTNTTVTIPESTQPPTVPCDGPSNSTNTLYGSINGTSVFWSPVRKIKPSKYLIADRGARML